LFPNRKGGPISVRYAEKIIEEIARAAGMEIHPHGLRHTAATNMLRAGVDLATVAQILGHASLDTTATYTKPDAAAMQKAVDQGEV
jgi:integrase/recombinase XerC